MSGTKTVIHPTARILAEGGPIIIGSNNLVMENTVIINKLVLSMNSSQDQGMHYAC